MTKITIGIVNCNRLFYLKAQVTSLIASLATDTRDVQLIVVDNASSEESTKDYLKYLKSLTCFAETIVIEREFRDPSNEFAIALNSIVLAATGEIIIPLQGDAQFIRREWLRDVTDACNRRDCGCVIIDAQRAITHHKNEPIRISNSLFIDFARRPIAGAGDVAYPSRVIKRLAPWRVQNESHEGGHDSETEFLNRNSVQMVGKELLCYVLAVPAMLTIQTDPIGTNARVRGDKRYGEYFPAQSNDLYYEMSDALRSGDKPASAEDVIRVCRPIGWHVSLGSDGSWLKNPIDPLTATPAQWVTV